MDTLFWRDLLCTALGLSVLVGIVWLCVWMVRRAVKVKRRWLRWTMRLVGISIITYLAVCFVVYVCYCRI